MKRLHHSFSELVQEVEFDFGDIGVKGGWPRSLPINDVQWRLIDDDGHRYFDSTLRNAVTGESFQVKMISQEVVAVTAVMEVRRDLLVGMVLRFGSS